jgi:hypothetical protein
MTSSRISLAALFAAAVVACGGGGTGEGSGSPTDTIPGSEQPNYNDQAPSGNPNAPGNSYDPLPASDDQPGSNPGGSPGGGGTPPGGTGICPRLCTNLAAKGCDVGSPSECASDCSEALAEGQAEGCLNELVSFYDCFLGGSAFVCTDGEPDIDDEDLLAECESQVLAYAECSGQIPEPGPEPGGECSNGQCDGCVDACEACMCALDDEALCASSCGQ